MKKFLPVLFLIFIIKATAQTGTSPTPATKPKIVIGIVVDQMRWDYLYRYADKYTSTGFKRLQTGYNCENTHIPYVPTYTAPGHTCIYTGSVPSIHGIIGNDWYDREAKQVVTNVGDTNYHTVGANGPEGMVSPNRMLATTITDELRVATNFRSKVIGISAKDRGAILPAGHAANAAYFFDGNSGNFVTSSYYMDSLPAWANAFNAKKLPAAYVKDNWKTVLELNKYAESTDDDEDYEKPFGKEKKPVFPHMVYDEVVSHPGALIATPWGNTLVFDFAKATLLGEKMGMSGHTDFLAMSCSSTDYIGHTFGPNSVETEDCYIRFDRDLSDFLFWLDKQYGAGNYTVFLSADHGASHSSGFNQKHRLLSGVYKNDTLIKYCNDYLKSKYNQDNLVERVTNMQLYLDHTKLTAANLDLTTVKKTLIEYLLMQKNVAKAFDLAALGAEPLEKDYKEMFINGYYPKRSGDVQVVYEPGYLEGYTKGTTHGTVYSYDTHIPLLWYGWGIKKGYDYSPTYMTDIAATLAALLHIQEPSGCVGKPIEGVLKK